MSWYLETLPDGHILIGPDGLERSFDGETWKGSRTPVWKTLIQEAASGDEARATTNTMPRYRFRLKYDESEGGFLSEEEMQVFVGLFNQCRGATYGLTLVAPNDCLATNQQIGTGNGVTSEFQLVRTWGGVQATVGSITYTSMAYGWSDDGFRCAYMGGIAVNGVSVSSDYWSLDADTGIVTFASGHYPTGIVTATFHYAWRVRFVEDEYEFEDFLYQLHTLQSVDFITIRRDA